MDFFGFELLQKDGKKVPEKTETWSEKKKNEHSMNKLWFQSPFLKKKDFCKIYAFLFFS